ncbi:hypothetical protein D3C78_1108680 [compost metagenome]
MAILHDLRTVACHHGGIIGAHNADIDHTRCRRTFAVADGVGEAVVQHLAGRETLEAVADVVGDGSISHGHTHPKGRFADGHDLEDILRIRVGIVGQQVAGGEDQRSTVLVDDDLVGVGYRRTVHQLLHPQPIQDCPIVERNRADPFCLDEPVGQHDRVARADDLHQ